MPTQLLNLRVEADFRKERGDVAAEPASRRLILVNGIPENLSRLLLHAPAVPPRPPLQSGLDRALQISHDELSHDRLQGDHDIMISNVAGSLEGARRAERERLTVHVGIMATSIANGINHNGGLHDTDW